MFVCFYLRILNSFIYPHSKSYSAVFTAPHIYLIKMRNPEKVNQKYLGPLWISQHLEAVVLQGKKFYSWSDVKSWAWIFSSFLGSCIYVQDHFSLCLIKCLLFQKISLVCNQLSLSTNMFWTQNCFNSDKIKWIIMTQINYLLLKYNHFSKPMVHPMNLNATSNPQVSRMMPNVTS